MYYLFEVHDVGMQEAAVVNNFSLNIYTCKSLSSLEKLDGYLQHSPTRQCKLYRDQDML